MVPGGRNPWRGGDRPSVSRVQVWSASYAGPAAAAPSPAGGGRLVFVDGVHGPSDSRIHACEIRRPLSNNTRQSQWMLSRSVWVRARSATGATEKNKEGEDVDPIPLRLL